VAAGDLVLRMMRIGGHRPLVRFVLAERRRWAAAAHPHVRGILPQCRRGGKQNAGGRNRNCRKLAHLMFPPTQPLSRRAPTLSLTTRVAPAEAPARPLGCISYVYVSAW